MFMHAISFCMIILRLLCIVCIYSCLMRTIEYVAQINPLPTDILSVLYLFYFISLYNRGATGVIPLPL